MRRLWVNALLFTSGLLIAVSLALGGYLSSPKESPRGNPKPPSVGSDNFDSQDELALSSDPFASPDEQATAAQPEPVRPAPLTPLGVLLAALEDGTLDSLQLLRMSVLVERPDYDTVLLPALKAKALEELIRRFARSDWVDWPRAAYNASLKPSDARLYLNNVQTVNERLGRYLETAALLLHRMFRTVESGENYDLKVDFPLVLANAEDVLSYLRKPALPSRELLDQTLPTDPIFLALLAKLQGDTIARYTAANPKDIEHNLELIISQNPAESGPELFEALGAILNRVSLSSSERLRERVIFKELQSRSIERFAKHEAAQEHSGAADGGVRQALAQLFVVGALDAVDLGDREGAKALLHESETVHSGLTAQKALNRYLSAEPPVVASPKSSQPQSVDEADPTAEAVGSVLEQTEVDEESGFSIIALIPLLFIGALGALAWRFWLSNRGLSTTLTLPEGQDLTSSQTSIGPLERPDRFVLDEGSSPYASGFEEAQEDRKAAN